MVEAEFTACFRHKASAVQNAMRGISHGGGGGVCQHCRVLLGSAMRPQVVAAPQPGMLLLLLLLLRHSVAGVVNERGGCGGGGGGQRRVRRRVVRHVRGRRWAAERHQGLIGVPAGSAAVALALELVRGRWRS